MESSEASPLDISSRSFNVRKEARRFRCTSDVPPFNLSTPNIEPAFLSTVRPIKLKLLLLRHKHHTFIFSILFKPRFYKSVITT
jgi:hypothetical protein